MISIPMDKWELGKMSEDRNPVLFAPHNDIEVYIEYRLVVGTMIITIPKKDIKIHIHNFYERRPWVCSIYEYADSIRLNYLKRIKFDKKKALQEIKDVLLYQTRINKQEKINQSLSSI